MWSSTKVSPWAARRRFLTWGWEEWLSHHAFLEDVTNHKHGLIGVGHISIRLFIATAWRTRSSQQLGGPISELHFQATFEVYWQLAVWSLLRRDTSYIRSPAEDDVTCSFKCLWLLACLQSSGAPFQVSSSRECCLNSRVSSCVKRGQKETLLDWVVAISICWWILPASMSQTKVTSILIHPAIRHHVLDQFKKAVEGLTHVKAAGVYTIRVELFTAWCGILQSST